MDRRETVVISEFMELQEQQVLPAHMDLEGPRASLDHQESKECLFPKEKMV